MSLLIVKVAELDRQPGDRPADSHACVAQCEVVGSWERFREKGSMCENGA